MERRKRSGETAKDTEYGTVKYEDEVGPSWKFWRKRRYVVGILAFLGFFTSYILRVNLSVAIVAMTSPVRKEHNGTVVFEPEFNWDSKTQGLVLSSFFYGYLSTQLFGGWLAARIGGKRVFGLGIAATALFTIITPPLTRISVYILLALRIIEGICEGVTYPCIHAIWAQWAPPLERSKLATLAFSGSFVGTVFAMPVAGLMTEYWGWASVFYVFGAVGLLWFVLWWIVVKDKPQDDPWITEAELEYIKGSLGVTKSEEEKIAHPWKEMLTSPPVWAIVAAHFSENWGFYTMLTQLPTFMSDVFDFKLDKTGYLSALPYLAMALIVQFSGHLADYLRTKKILTTTQVRKLFNCGAFIFQTVFMTATTFISTTAGVVISITIAVGLGGFAWSGFGVNHLDIAPKHASVLMGIGNTIATLPGVVSPIITGYIVQNKDPAEWRIVFIIAGAVYLVGAVIYGIFASGEKQPWADLTESRAKEPKKSYDNPAMETDNL